MFELVCVTNRKAVEGDFFEHIKRLVAAKPSAVILREKDLTHAQYLDFATQVHKICLCGGVKLILHSDVEAAARLRLPVHLPLPVLRKTAFSGEKGASCHSVDDALEAESAGCSYITAGHIFDTDCKKGVPGRGVEFLKSVVSSIHIPVYAIGGINVGNIRDAIDVGARGACIMSAAMSGDAVRIVSELKYSIENYKKEQKI